VRRALVLVAVSLCTVAITQAPAFATADFQDVSAVTQGPSLLITFTETGLVAGQNYAYTAAGSYTETFQCYRDRTFTPTHKITTVSGQADPDPRVYTADETGAVTGFVYLWPNFPFPDFCPARQSEVPVHICYQPRDLVQFVEPFDVYWFAAGTTVCGAIEPD
jgi:hypothetical protein